MSIRGISHNSLSFEVRQKVTDILEYRIADLMEFRSQLKQAHWNIRDPLFFFLHEMFDQFSIKIDELTDITAERSTALGCLIHGSSKMVADRTSLTALDIEERTASGLVTQLVKNCAKLSASTLSDSKKVSQAGDEVTCDILIETTAELDKILWFLESHLPSTPVGGKHESS